MSDLVISIHVPKTAGSSLLHAFRAAYGDMAVLRIDDAPLDPESAFHTDRDSYMAQAAAETIPPSIKVVHGHFPAMRYSHLRDGFRLTFLRDPIDRLLSHYFFWRESPQRGHTLLDRFRDEEMTVIDFAEVPLIANLYSEVLFCETDMSSFDFIGDVARFGETVDHLGRTLGVDLEKPRLRENPYSRYEEEVQAVKHDEQTMRSLRRLLASDIEFYQEALAG